MPVYFHKQIHSPSAQNGLDEQGLKTEHSSKTQVSYKNERNLTAYAIQTVSQNVLGRKLSGAR